MKALSWRFARSASVAAATVVLFLLSALTALAEPISVTAYVETANDLVDGLQAQVPTIVGAVIALGAGLIFIGIVWRILKRFVR